MKKIIFAILLGLIYLTNTNAQTVDTTAILNGLLQNKPLYINQPLSKLLGVLGNLKVKESSSVIPNRNVPEMVDVEYLNLYFDDSEEISSYLLSNITFKFIRVRFNTRLPIPRYYYLRDNVLDWTQPWNFKKAAYYGQFSIVDFEIIGL